MKHEVKYQELNDEQLTMVAGGYRSRGHHNNGYYYPGNSTTNNNQGSPTSLNLNEVSQSVSNSKNVDQNSSSYQSSNASNTIK